MQWYKRYPRDWISSETRYGFSLAERGLYLDLLDIQSIEGSIPSDPRVLARMSAVPIEEFEASWPAVSKKFVEDSQNPGRLVNPKMAAVLSERDAIREKRAASGRKGAETRFGDSSASAKQMHSKSSASAKSLLKQTDSVCSSIKETDTETDTEENPKPLRSPDGDRTRVQPAKAAQEPTEATVPRPEAKRQPAADTEERDGRFEAWYKAYPRKIKRTLAEERWARLWRRSKTDIELLEKNSPAWFDEFRERPDDKIPHPPTFISSRAWEEPPPPLGKPASRRLTGYEEAMERLRRKDAAERQADQGEGRSTQPEAPASTVLPDGRSRN